MRREPGKPVRNPRRSRREDAAEGSDMAQKDPLISQLKSRREALGWSLEDVSDRCAIDQKLLSDWEYGIGSPRLDAVQRWGAALGVKLTLVSPEDEARQGLRIDWAARRVLVDGTPVRLTPMEWKGLERLAWTPGELVTHDALFHHLYGDDQTYRAQSTAIRVLITKLRRLLPLRIEARWGQGYVVSGIGSSLSRPRSEGNGAAPSHVKSQAITPARSVCLARAAETAAPTPRPAPQDVLDLSEPPMRRVAPEPSRCGLGRAEELGVIERFLAERGVTRCPDVATIQHSPLPTLVWDKIKRKWVRPSLGDAGRADAPG